MSEHETVYLIARILTSAVWIGVGLFVLLHFGGFAGKLAGHGFPFPALVASGVLAIELGGGVLMVADLWAWAVALVWIGFILWATWLDHRHVIGKDGGLVFQEYGQVLKNLSIIGGLVCIILLDDTTPGWLLP